jgi:hypothetical protein
VLQDFLPGCEYRNVSQLNVNRFTHSGHTRMSYTSIRLVMLLAMVAGFSLAEKTLAQDVNGDQGQRSALEKQLAETLDDLLDEKSQDELQQRLERALRELEEGVERAGGELEGGWEELAERLESEIQKLLQAADQDIQRALNDPQTEKFLQAIQQGDLPTLIKSIGQPAQFRLGLVLENNADEIRVAQVAADSPAAKAGFQAGDLIHKVDGQAVKSLADLVKLVRDSAGRELAIEIVRSDKKMKIKVTAEKSDPFAGLDPELMQQIEELLGEMDRAPLREFERLERTSPSALQLLNELPDNVSITLKKSGKRPPEIIVSRDDKVWKIKPDQINQLPDDLQPIVQRALGISGREPKVSDNNRKRRAGEGTKEKEEAVDDDEEDAARQQLQQQLKKLQTQLDAIKQSLEDKK